MRKMNKILGLFLLITIMFVGCKKDDDNSTDPDTETTVTLENSINSFVWRGLNSYYYWQADVPNLADTKNDVTDDFYTYLNGYSDPEDLFESLLYDAGTTDRFSWFIDDYEEQDASFRGVDDAYGFDFNLARLCSDCDEVIGYVTYVVPDSPAADAGMARGDIFYKVDGQEMTISDYAVVYNYYYNDNLSLEFGTVNYTDYTITSTGVTADLTIREVAENPVHYSSVITTSSGTKVGYLVYNGFKYTYHEELNNVFATFISEGITELVLDLRYNGGGSVLTSAYLASMIDGSASTGDIFGKLVYNSKHADDDGSYNFYNTARIYDKDGDDTGSNVSINRLSTISNLYVITSSSTASASEMIINGLRPYLSNVITIGTTTYGKNVGSITLYDSPDFTSYTTINSTHTNAMQPIVFKIFNKLDESDYTDGFAPDYEVVEYASEMKPFGDVEEPLLETALNLIDGVSAKSKSKIITDSAPIFSSQDKKKFAKEMYIIPQEEQ